MHKKFQLNWTNIKEDCQSYTKAAPQKSWSDLTLVQWLEPKKSGGQKSVPQIFKNEGTWYLKPLQVDSEN